MGKYGQIVMGPAGSGKSTYCQIVSDHFFAKNRSVHLVNLDPAAENLCYQPSVDIRQLVSLTDVMKAMGLGPNGGLIYCMEFLMENIEWLEEALGDYDEDYLIFDCPGQIELYTHIPIMRKLLKQLDEWNYRMCGVFLIDSHLASLPSKFISGALYSLSSMIQMEIAQVNILSKVDLLKKDPVVYKQMKKMLDVDTDVLLPSLTQETGPRLSKLNEAIASLVSNYSLVSFLPLDISDEDSINYVTSHIDVAIQFGEDDDVKVKYDQQEEE